MTATSTASRTEVPTTYTGDAHLGPCQFPQAHLNGTGRAALLAQYEAAEKGLSVFVSALTKCDLHARDFYLYPEAVEALDDAKATRTQVWALIDEISGYLTDHIKHYSAAS